MTSIMKVDPELFRQFADNHDFNRGDIDGLRVGFRAAVQELVQLCGWT